MKRYKYKILDKERDLVERFEIEFSNIIYLITNFIKLDMAINHEDLYEHYNNEAIQAGIRRYTMRRYLLNKYCPQFSHQIMYYFVDYRTNEMIIDVSEEV